MSDTIRLIAEFLQPASERLRLRCCSRCRGNTTCTADWQVPAAGSATNCSSRIRQSRYPSFCNGARHPSVAQLCGVQALPGNGISDCGYFPAGAGSGIYWTAFYVVTNDLERAGARGFLTLKDAVAIVLGILLVFEFPQSWFRKVLTDKSK